MRSRNLARWPVMMRAPLCSLRWRKLRRFDCAWCHRAAWICRHCDHGHRYCSRECSREARLAAQREASICYQKTEVGRARHAARSARYRRRQREMRTATSCVTQHGLAFSGQERKLMEVRPPARCCVVCAAPGRRADPCCAAVRRIRRVAPWRRRRQSRTGSSSWSTTSWSCATRACVCAGRTWRAAYSRAWIRTASNSRWW
jgi:hypothetical protein